MAVEKIKPLTKKQLDTLRKKLEEEKNSLIFSMELDPAAFGLNAEDVSDELDQAVADHYSSHLLRFRNREAFYAKKLDKALKKFEKNEYGLCCECAGPIKYERLLARPTAEMCIVCKEESERDESGNFFGRQSKSLGKTVDLSGLMAN